MPSDAPQTLLAVIVVFGISPAESKSFISLREAIRRIPDRHMRVRILLHDNSPNPIMPQESFDDVDYVATRRNVGISEACNHAIDIAEAGGYSWLLTLDQDTTLPADFLEKLSGVMANVDARQEIAAIVPQLSDGKNILSPEYLLFNAFPRFFPRGFQGVAERATFAFNSASALRVSALREIGGYSPIFWLDCSDAYVYSRLNKSGKKVYVAGNIKVKHEFAMSDKKRLPLERYWNIVNAGSAFRDAELGVVAGWWHTAHLLARPLKHRLRGDDPAMRQITRSMLRSRLTESRQTRIARWQAAEGYRPGASEQKAPVDDRREAVSVCMAAHNGERYIKEQIHSILVQLDESDELIIVDDASTDATRDRVRGIEDRRIRLIESGKNEGVLASFERAIREASRRIVFLSDQDDIWEPYKITRMMREFRRDSEVKIVLTATRLIDECGQELPTPPSAKKAKFSDGFWSNLIRNKYQGCTMAFRSDLIPAIMPFPTGVDVLHDVWIGSRNRLSGGKTIFIDEPLVRYRRHSENVTGNRRLTRWRQLHVRFGLLRALLAYRPQRSGISGLG
ncbi:MAG: glycosyltransferase [Terracidiphilus sp.]